MRKYFPALLWGFALLALYLMDTGAAHSFCIFKGLGFSSCWGCGIGHAIHHTLHFRLLEAWLEHPLGIPATLALFWLAVRPFTYKHTSYEPTTVNDAGPSTR